MIRFFCLLFVASAAAAQSTWDPGYPVSNRIIENTFIHSEPSENSQLVAGIDVGDSVFTNACENGWCPVKRGDERGFVEASVLASPEIMSGFRLTANPDVYDDPTRPRLVPSSIPPANPAAGAFPDQTEERIVGSKRSRAFHLSSCSHVSRIADHNLVTYESVTDAVSQGKRPCKVCHPAVD